MFINNSIVSGNAVSKMYTVMQYGISYWPMGTDTVVKVNYYDKEYSNPDGGSDTDGIHIGMGYVW